MFCFEYCYWLVSEVHELKHVSLHHLKIFHYWLFKFN